MQKLALRVANMDQKQAIEIARAYVEAMRGKIEFSRVLILGSYTRGNFREESDIDIAVILPEFNNLLDIQLELMHIRRKIDSRIEPHPIREIDFNEVNPFAFKIMNHGVEIV